MQSGKLVIFLYHDVTCAPSAFSRDHNLNVSPERFRQQVRMIIEDFDVISPLDLDAPSKGRPRTLITFDDGLPSYFEEALPILEEFNCPSLIFLNIAPMEGEVFWSGLVTFLSRSPEFQEFAKSWGIESSNLFLLCTPLMVDEFLSRVDRQMVFRQAREYYGRFSSFRHLEQAQTSRLCFFGSHLYNHFNAKSLTEPDLRQAYLKNHERLSKYPNYISLFSYPFGQPGTCYDSGTDKLIESLGAKWIFSAYPLPNRPNSKFLNRISMVEQVQSREALRYRTTAIPWINANWKRGEFASLHSWR